MFVSSAGTTLGLLVCSAPWAERSGREALDLALAAAVLDRPLSLFFIGDGLWQLLHERDPTAAMLPPGQKAWASLLDLTTAAFYRRADQPVPASSCWWLEPTALPPADWQLAQQRCTRLLVC